MDYYKYRKRTSPSIYFTFKLYLIKGRLNLLFSLKSLTTDTSLRDY